MLLKKGSQGSEVKKLQSFLGVTANGIFGSSTEDAVMNWQNENGHKADGVVGPEIWAEMGLSTSGSGSSETSISIEDYFLSTSDYLAGPTSKEYLFLHHTAGWNNPYGVVDDWNNDGSQVATEFVIGGQSIKGNDNQYDGKIIQTFPEGAYGWHLGDNGSQYMHEHSVGIEVCNFGYIKDGKTWAGTTPDPSQLVELDAPFRTYTTWHRYSDQQLASLKKLILHVAERDNIDVHLGLISEIKKNGVAAFEFNEDAYYGRIKGMWTHTNTRKDKTDMFPQQELIDMLLSL